MTPAGRPLRASQGRRLWRWHGICPSNEMYPVWSKNSCGFARVEFQKSPEPFATLDRALTV